MENAIPASCLNDFIFCPASIYFHRLYGGMDTMSYQTTVQVNGTSAHDTVDNNRYSTRKDIITGLDVYSEQYGVTCRTDIYDKEKGILRERKKKIYQIYDGYVFQVYAQYFALVEMGYSVKRIELYSMDDNKTYIIPLPENDKQMYNKFKKIIEDITFFNIEEFIQTNSNKCKHCIYEPACDRSLMEETDDK